MFTTEPQISFLQVYLSPDRRGAAVDADARLLLARLSAAGPTAAIDHVGDVLMLPGEVGNSSRTDVARQFGDEFADAILKVEPGRWTGPLRSGYGLHLVFVRERKDGRLPGLAEVRPIVEREFLSDRRKRRLNDMYEQMLARYRVTVEPRAGASQAAAASASAAQGGSK